MDTGFVSPDQAFYWGISGYALFLTIHLVGLICFAYIVGRRLVPLVGGAADYRLDRPLLRFRKVLQFWLGQWKHPRYLGAGILHILIFGGFVVLAVRAFSVLLLGAHQNFTSQQSMGPVSAVYEIITDYAATVVFVCMVVAIVRRLAFQPARYAVPAKYGKGHAADGIFLLALIAVLMVTDSLFEGSKASYLIQQGSIAGFPAMLSLPWLAGKALAGWPATTQWVLFCGAYVLHQLTFYFLLCYRPFGIQFHVETSLFNVFFSKLDRGTVKPVRRDVQEEDLDKLGSIGAKSFEDFTWKHMLDFYSCADCGRCSDSCPANAVGRPLSPRFVTIKARDYCFAHYPVFGRSDGKVPLSTIYSPDEIWSCTTCGACEEECPLMVEYIDKIVDLRRGLIDSGNVPQTLQRPLKALESRGNPYGKLEKKRGDWASGKESGRSDVRVLDRNETAETLYFVDSITSYDDRMQAIARATANVLGRAGVSFGILGTKEKDSGHEVRRFGEETLFRMLRDHNTKAIQGTRAQHIVTADPHAYNALKHDYKGLPPIQHISQVMAQFIKSGKLKLKSTEDPTNVYTYHDPCYLGRHNQVYDEPRFVLDVIPGLRRVEMKRSRDRSFCCGGGGLALFYEPKETERMGVVRVRMAAEAGANIIVTACPYCMTNIEDAIKVAGLEGKMTAIDLAELVEQHMVREDSAIKRPEKETELIAVEHRS